MTHLCARQINTHENCLLPDHFQIVISPAGGIALTALSLQLVIFTCPLSVVSMKCMLVINLTVINLTVRDGLREADVNPPIDEAPPSLDEVREAVSRLMGGKAACVRNISAELIKAEGEEIDRGLHAVLTVLWQSGIIPLDCRRGMVVPVYEGKGNRQSCNNYRDITLLSVPGKVFVHMLLVRIRQFMLAACVDFKKALASVHCKALRDLLRFCGTPARIDCLLISLCSGTESAANPLGLLVSWAKAKAQVLGGSRN